MLKVRVIPVMTFNGVALVKTKQFTNPRMVGNPMQTARVYNTRGVDELIFIDIYATKQNRKINSPIVKQVLNECFMPVTVGGGISSIEDIKNLLGAGADKVVIKTSSLKNPALIEKGAKIFGTQCMVISVDVIQTSKSIELYNPDEEKLPSIKTFIELMQNCGAGEFFINHVDNDGMMQGMNSDLFENVLQYTKAPSIICGGAVSPTDIASTMEKVKANAIASASIFHFTQFTPYDVKFALSEKNIPVRLFDAYKQVNIN